MPGVTVITATRSGPASAVAPAEASYFVVGLTERGPTGRAVELRSLGDYKANFGDRVSYGALYDDLRTHFEEGGVRAYVVRAVGPAATVGTATLSTAGGAGTLRVDAANAGAWSTRVSLQVAAGSTAGKFTLTVKLDGAVVETYPDLASPAAAATALAGSTYVRGTDLGEPTAAPGNNPVIVANAVLSAGVDDRAGVTNTVIGAQLALFGDALGTGVVAIPGYPSSAVGNALIEHAQVRHRVALTATPAAYTQAQAIAAGTTLSTGGTVLGAEYIALIWPWVQIRDGAVTRFISPEGYAAACRARAIVREGGPWRAPFGEIAAARFVIGTETPVDRAASDTLDAAGVSAIVTRAGVVRLYGWRSLSSNTDNYGLLTARDVINLLHTRAEEQLEQFVGATVDAKGQLLSRLEAELRGLLEPVARAGGLYPLVDAGNVLLDPGYVVDVGPAVNTPDSLRQNKLRAVIGVRTAPSATIVELTIVKAAATAAL